MKNIHLVISVAGAMMLSAMPVEIYAQLLAGTSGYEEGKVYAYQGGTNWTAISPSLGHAAIPGTTEFCANARPTLQAQDTTPALVKFQSFSLQGGYVASGVGMRNRGFGHISVAGIPAGSIIHAAYLYWDILGTTNDDTFSQGEINGQQITGQLVATGGDPCWDNATCNFAYRADVTSLVTGNGTYSLTNFASGTTDGSDPWAVGSSPPMMEGASLVIIYKNLSSPPNTILIYEGAALTSGYTGNLLEVTIDGFIAPNSMFSATTTFIGADGQAAVKPGSMFNGNFLPTVAWYGSDPQDGPTFSLGNLWDTMTVDVTSLISPGDTSATATVQGGPDCMVWIAQVFSITYDPLLITPAVGFDATGCVGGPFSTTNETFSLSNMGTNSLTWSLANTSSWLNASPGGGTLATGGTTNVTVSLSSNAYSLTSRIYTATVWFTNLNDGVVQSRQFTLAVGLPTILSQPQGLAVCDGSPASFGVSVSGTPLYFQWQKDGTNLTDGTNISGSTTATLVLNPTTTNDDGSYTVIITDACGSVTSSVAVLAVELPPTIVSQPQSLFVTNGATASFNVSVSGTPTLYFQWQKNGTNLTDGTNISGSTTATLVLNPTTTNDDGSYTVIITNTCGSVISSVASLVVVSSPVVLPPGPTNQTVMAGGTATFSVAVFGIGPFTYQWQLNGTNLPNGIITTVAGNGGYGYSGDNGRATNASLNNPYSVAVDAASNLFIADRLNNVIRKVDPNGFITTVAGNYNTGGSYGGDGGRATNASLHWPAGVVVDASGNLFIADTANQRIRKVDTNGFITTVAGNGSYGYSGDGTNATNANLANPSGVAVDASGNLFIADTDNNVIRKVDNNGTIMTVAGNYNTGGSYGGDGGQATNASLYSPLGVAVDASGNLYIADWDNSVIRKVDNNGIITTMAGNYSTGGNYDGDGGAATNASLDVPRGLAVAAFGDLFIADTGNNVIRKVDNDGFITTVAGNYNTGGSYGGDGSQATNASLNDPFGVAMDASGDLFIADTENQRIREVVLFATYPTLTLCNVTTNNAGNYTVFITSPYGSVTSSVATLTVASSPIIYQIVCNANGSVMLNLLTTPNISSRVLATTNLTPPVVWQPIYSNVAGANGAWQFTDTNASNYPVRFYRSSTP
ncbi:MAG: immunoglobulin domain-containing protein [Verrucomicrobiota bacterium]